MPISGHGPKKTADSAHAMLGLRAPYFSCTPGVLTNKAKHPESTRFLGRPLHQVGTLTRDHRVRLRIHCYYIHILY